MILGKGENKMGYTTDFTGKIEITPVLPPELIKYINEFGTSRRMKRNVEKLQEKYNGKFGFNGKYGVDGEYFIGDKGYSGQFGDSTVIDNNTPPRTQPGLWCQWEITNDGKFIEWDGSEKFYESVEWMKYIINNFIGDKYSCNGKIEAQGEDEEDHWWLIVDNNEVRYEGW
jgi:hypothetical protein